MSATLPTISHQHYMRLHKLYALIGCGVVGLMFTGQALEYMEGRSLGVFSASVQVIAFVLIGLAGLACAVLFVWGFCGIVRKRVGPVCLLLLSAPFALKFALSWIRLPTFADGAASVLREKTAESDWVTWAQRISATEDLSNPSREQMDRLYQVLRRDPAFADLPFGDRVLYLRVKESTLQLEWVGSPIVDRWGIAISSTGRRPDSPDRSMETKQVYPAVYVYMNPF